jgi:hypothetical protein
MAAAAAAADAAVSDAMQAAVQQRLAALRVRVACLQVGLCDAGRSRAGRQLGRWDGCLSQSGGVCLCVRGDCRMLTGSAVGCRQAPGRGGPGPAPQPPDKLH